MVGLQGLGGVPDPKPGGPAKVRNDRDNAVDSARGTGDSSAAAGEDGVVISSEARAAAAVVQIIESTRTQTEIRTDKVDAARERLAQGSYKDPQVVSQLADKLLKYL